MKDKTKKAVKEDDNKITLEEEIDNKIQSLTSGGTKVTLEAFLAWKEKKKENKEII